MKKTKFIMALSLALSLFTELVFAAPIPAPMISAESAVLMDADSGKIMYSKDMNKRMFPASTTKLLTALVVLDYFEPEALIKVGTEINIVPYDSSKAGHEAGETLSVKNLIRGLIIPSGNDTSNILASAVAKKVKSNENLPYSQCEEIFIELMNQKAASIGAVDSNFINPHGYHSENHYSTAYDIALISMASLQNPVISQIASEMSFSGNGAGNTLESSSTLLTKQYNWVSHNLLLSRNSEYFYEYATGLKTGFTDEAGDCIAASAKKGSLKLIAIVLNSEDPGRWLDAAALFEYGFNNFTYKTIQNPGKVLDNVKLKNQNPLGPDTLKVAAINTKALLLSQEELELMETRLTYDLDLLAENGQKVLKAPIAKADRVGRVEYIINGKVVYEDDVYAAEDIGKKTIFNTLSYFFKNIPAVLFSQRGIIILAAAIAAIILILMIRAHKKSRQRYYYKFRKRKK